MLKKILKSIDYSILVIAITLFAIGLVALFSANGGLEGDIGETKKQVTWFLIGFAVMCVIVVLDYEVLGKLWKFLFAISTLLLIGVLFTDPINGATSWYNFGGVSLQPSEFSKIALVLGLRKDVTKGERERQDK